MKKAISLILCLLFTISCCPIMAMPAAAAEQKQPNSMDLAMDEISGDGAGANETYGGPEFVPGVEPADGELIYPTYERKPGGPNKAPVQMPARYDGRDYQSTIKDQKANGLCWAFGTNAAIEAYMMKNNASEPDFSELHMGYSLSNHSGNSSQGFSRTPYDGGNRYKSASYLMRGTSLSGTVNEADDPYNEAKLNADGLFLDRDLFISKEKERSYSVQNMLYLTGDSKPTDSEVTEIKKAIMSYGGVGASMYWNGEATSVGASKVPEYYNPSTASYFYNGSTVATNHLVEIAGWDDNYSKENFSSLHRPSNNGAWLVKNSWGKGWGNNGYFWISYEDNVFPSEVFYISGVEPYDSSETVYETDYLNNGQNWGWKSSSQQYIAKVFEAKTSGETLKALRVFLASANATIEIDYVDNFSTSSDLNSHTFVRKGGLSAQCPGWYTINFDAPITLGNAGSKFAVLLKITTSTNKIFVGYDTTNTISSEQAFYSGGGTSWSGTTTNYCLKAITTPSETNKDQVVADKVSDDLSWDMIKDENTQQTSVRYDLTLPKTFKYGTTITWSAEPANIINTTTGKVTRPATNTSVKLTATIDKENATKTVEFPLTVIGVPVDDAAAVQTAANKITWDAIKNSNSAQDSVQTNLNLMTSQNEATVTWRSSNTNIIGTNGTVTRPRFDKINTVTITAIVTKGEAEQRVEFELAVTNREPTNRDKYDCAQEWFSADPEENWWKYIKGENEFPAQIRYNLVQPEQFTIPMEKGGTFTVQVRSSKGRQYRKDQNPNWIDWDYVLPGGEVVRPAYGSQNTQGYFNCYLPYDESNGLMGQGVQILTVLAYKGTIKFDIQPESKTIQSNQTSSLTVSASKYQGGDIGEIVYQWYEASNSSGASGKKLEGETSSTYTLPSGMDTGTYYFYCEASALDAAPVKSQVAAVKVEVPDTAITDSKVSLSSASAVYNATEQKPTITVKQGDATLAENTNYTVTYARNGIATTDFTGAGEITITVNGKGEYTGTVTKTYVIQKKTVTPAITGTTEKVYDGNEYAPSGIAISLNNVESGDVSDVSATATFKYDKADAGTRTITATGIALSGNKASNYVLSNESISTSGTITRATPAISFKDSYSPDRTYDGQAIPDPTENDVTITGISHGALSFTWSSTPLNAGTYTITATLAETTNTETARCTKTVTISKKTVKPTIVITPAQYEYTGNAIIPTKVEVKDGETIIPTSEYTLSYENNMQVGNATVKVADSGTGNYNITENTQTFEITKKWQAPLSITGKPAAISYGDTFSLGTNGGSGDGTITWAVTTGNAVATIDASGDVTITGVGSATITATKSGGINYADATATIEIVSAKKSITPAIIGTTEKVYDGTKSATGLSITLTGVLASDADKVSATAGSYTYDSADAGENRTITATNITLSGEKLECYTLSTTTAAIVGKITKSQPTLAFNSYTPSRVYNKSPLENPAASELSFSGASYSNITFTWYKDSVAEANKLSANPSDAGTYVVVAAIAETPNTASISATSSPITISPKEITANNNNITLEYTEVEFDGTEKTPSVIIKDGSDIIPSAEYSVSYSNNINKGDATVTITNNNGGNYTVSGSTTFRIAGKLLTGAKVVISGQYTYNGSPQTPVIAVTKDGATVPETGYEIAYSNSNGGADNLTNAGTVTVSVTGKGDYEGNVSATFVIAPAEVSVTGAAATGRKYNGSVNVAISAVALNGIINNDDVHVDVNNLTGIISSADVGNYTSVSLPEIALTGRAASNYKLRQPTEPVPTTVEIVKADAPTAKSGTLKVSNGVERLYSYKLSQLLPTLTDGMTLGPVEYRLKTVSITETNYYDTDPGAEIKEGALLLPIKAVESTTEDSIGTVTVEISSKNFETIDAEITVARVNKIVPQGEPTLSAATITYGQPISTITLSGVMKDGDNNVPGTFVWDSPDDKPDAGTYSAVWTFTPSKIEIYAGATGTVTITVNPANISGAVITLSKKSFAFNGAEQFPTITGVQLNGVELDAADYTASIPAGTNAGSYTVTIAGKGNYSGRATATFTINPVADTPVRPPELADDTENNKSKVTVESGLSDLPTNFSSIDTLNTVEKVNEVMRTKISQKNSSIAPANTAVYDVSLMVSTDGGNTWSKATTANFPADKKLTVTLPYPAGTDSSYTFTVVHMFTENNGDGKNVGDIETPNVNNTSNGISFTVTGLSPISVGWVKKTSQGGGSGGGGGWVSYYSVKVNESEHGKVTADRTSMYSGGTVTLTVKPDDGYKLDKITVTDSQGKALELTEKGGKYTFKMPGRDVTIKADFVPAVSPSPEPTGSPSPEPTGSPSPEPTDSPSPSPTGSPNPTTSPSPSPKPWKNPFPDVSDTGWYIKAVEFVCKNGLMAGYENGKFGPNDSLTRAQFAQIIYNKEGRPQAGSGKFSDVTTGWYADAVNWAAAEGIVAGVGGGKFAPNRLITRQDLAVMLWRYAGSPEPRKNELDFSDAGKVSEYAWKALCWANENGIVNGKGNRVLDPKGKATRAEAAQMLMNYLKM